MHLKQEGDPASSAFRTVPDSALSLPVVTIRILCKALDTGETVSPFGFFDAEGLSLSCLNLLAGSLVSR